MIDGKGPGYGLLWLVASGYAVTFAGLCANMLWAEIVGTGLAGMAYAIAATIAATKNFKAGRRNSKLPKKN
jgi:hypothetical protein